MKGYEMAKKINNVIVRSDRAGVFAGVLVSEDGGDVVLNKCRRLWYWRGAASLSQLAVHGVSSPRDCKFSVETNGHKIKGVIEIIPMTEAAVESVEGVPEWKS